MDGMCRGFEEMKRCPADCEETPFIWVEGGAIVNKLFESGGNRGGAGNARTVSNLDWSERRISGERRTKNIEKMKL